MKRNVVVDTEASTERLYAVVADLATYPEWLDIVSSVEAAEPDSGDEGPAWFITLRAQVGRFARSKRLRIVRTAAVEGESASFRRRELDGRDHAAWDMDADVTSTGALADTPADHGSRLTLDLAYSGGLWSNVLDALLGDEVEQALSRLPAYAASSPPG